MLLYSETLNTIAFLKFQRAKSLRTKIPNVKAKFTLERVTKPQTGSKALLFLEPRR